MSATARGVSLYPNDWQLLDDVADNLGLQGNKRRSPALQHVLRTYRRLLASPWPPLSGVDALLAAPSPKEEPHE